MSPRTAQILASVIQEFIETGEPVSSKSLYKKYDFGAKSATIRNELNELTNEEFLTQPHISSGRVPTDKGYKFLVNKILNEFVTEVSPAADREIVSLKSEFSHGDFDEFIDDVSEHLGILGVGYASVAHSVYKSGLDDLFGKLVSDTWFGDLGEIYQIVKDFETIDERVDDLLNFISSGDRPKVFIGKSPITRSRELSVIADRINIGGDEFLLAAVGPKRMDYETSIGFFIKLKKSIES